MNFFSSFTEPKVSKDPIPSLSMSLSSSATSISQTLPMYFRGDQSLLSLINLKIDVLLNIGGILSSSTILAKPHTISMPLKIQNYETKDFVEPLVQIETFDEMARESYLKNKSLLKEGTFYIYFPSSIRVDDKIHKIYSGNYESFIKELNKSQRQNFGKLIIWEGGKGDNSVEAQKLKLLENLSVSLKSIIEKKIENMLLEINNIQTPDPSLKTLKNMFILKSKLASIYKQLRLPAYALEHLTSLYQDLLFNHKKISPALNSPQQQKPANESNTKGTPSAFYQSPFIVKSINTIVGYFDTYKNFLQIINFCFLKVFEMQLSLLQQLEAMKRLKHFLDYILGNVFTNVRSREDDICRSIWHVQIIDECLRILNSKPLPSIMNPAKEEEYSLINVSVCSQYRNAIEKIGVIIYGINTYSVFPRNLEYEIELCLTLLKGGKLTDEQYPELKLHQATKKTPEINKMQFLSGEPVSETVELLLNNFDSFKLIYVKTLELMEKTLNESPYRKVAWSMKLSVLKATIIYFNLKDEKRISVGKLLEEDKIFSHDGKKSVWQKLQVINKVYRLTLCKRYSVKMGIEDLLNIVLDDNIIDFESLWSELTQIVSQLLFEYRMNDGEDAYGDELDYIDYGEQDDSESEDDQGEPILQRRSRRKTTIHFLEKEVEVGTFRYIQQLRVQNRALESPNQGPLQENSRIRISIELSNRIVSYAAALIRKSKATKSTNPQNRPEPCGSKESQQEKQPSERETESAEKQLIALHLKVRTANNETLVMPVQMIDTEDKFIEVEVSELSGDVVIFRIQQLLININDNIKLVYVMPLNPDKLDTYEEAVRSSQNFEGEDMFVNISPQFKLNTVSLEEPIVPHDSTGHTVNGRNHDISRKGSVSSATSRVVSSDTGDFRHQIYKNIWTPLTFPLRFNSGHKVKINKIDITCQDEIFKTVFIGQTQLRYGTSINHEIQSSNSKESVSELPLVIFVRTKQPSEGPKSRKGSLNIQAQKQPLTSNQSQQQVIPASLMNRSRKGSRNRKRNDSMRGSFMSNLTSFSHPHSTVNKISIKVHLQHGSYDYLVECAINYSKKSPFKITYKYADLFEEYTIRNLCQEDLKMTVNATNGPQSQQESEIILTNEQELKIFQSSISMGFLGMEAYVEKLGMDEAIDLKRMIKKEYLKPEKVATTWIDILEIGSSANNRQFPIFEPINLKCPQIGTIAILKSDSKSYELLGRVEGSIKYIDQEEQILELYLFPTRKGYIQLPQISINTKKAIWLNSVIQII